MATGSKVVMHPLDGLDEDHPLSPSQMQPPRTQQTHQQHEKSNRLGPLSEADHPFSSHLSPSRPRQYTEAYQAGEDALRSSSDVLSDMDGMLDGWGEEGAGHKGGGWDRARAPTMAMPGPLPPQWGQRAIDEEQKASLPPLPAPPPEPPRYDYGQDLLHQGFSQPYSGYGGSQAADDNTGYRPLSRVHHFNVHTFYAPTFCDACSRLLVGVWQQGVRCGVCGMNVHPDCQHVMCTPEHKCRRPEQVVTSLEPGTSPRTQSQAPSGLSDPKRLALADTQSEDPLDSDWHKMLLRNKQVWVPDSAALGCMVCDRLFSVVRRRHHCRRCGACVCGDCSANRTSDKDQPLVERSYGLPGVFSFLTAPQILMTDKATGRVQTAAGSNEPVRTCTKCTRVIDEHLARSLRKQGWKRSDGQGSRGGLGHLARGPSTSSQRINGRQTGGTSGSTQQQEYGSPAAL